MELTDFAKAGPELLPPAPPPATDASTRPVSVEGIPSRSLARLELPLVVLAAVLLAVAFTYPLAFRLADAGRLDSEDGQFSVWNVAWVAHALTTDPSRLFDANIFYPHTGSLAFSEANIVAGVMATPVYYLTGNPYAAHNSVVLLAFVLSTMATYLLVRYLTGSRPAAAVSGVLFAYCPFVFARMPHIQLLMTAGLPLVLLALHAFVDRPQVRSALWLALALAGQALASGYYGIFASLSVSGGVVYFGVVRGRARDHRYWLLVALAATLALAMVWPFLEPYVSLYSGETQFRSLTEAGWWSADWRAYLTGGGRGHRWLMETLGRGNEVLFPGFVTLALGLPALAIGLRDWRLRRTRPVVAAERARGIVLFYALVGATALWLSFGPKAGLYTLCYQHLPLFDLLRAPARAGIVVTLVLVVLAGVTTAALVRKMRHGSLAAVALGLLAAADLSQAPIRLADAPPPSPAYAILARLPRGPVAEFPFYSQRPLFPRHASYMLNSAWHWQPLINGYSDYIPPDFRAIGSRLGTFPSKEGFDVLWSRGARYAVFHVDRYRSEERQVLVRGLEKYREYLRPLFRDDEVWLYEIVHYPAR